MIQVEEILAQARDSLTVRRVFGDPIERDGVTVIPVANVMGGAGGGSGEGPVRVPGDGEAGAAETGATPTGSGSGGGFGIRATPAGVYVIDGDDVRWVPAIDATRIAIIGQVIVIVFLLVVRSIVKPRTKG